MTDNNSQEATNSSFPPSDLSADKAGWVETTLGEICEITSSKRIFLLKQ